MRKLINAGILVFRPDSSYHQDIMQLWWETTVRDTCPNDQDLLFMYFLDAGKWKALPYTYNIRRIVYRSMKSFHFACCHPPKPWSAGCRPSRKEVAAFQGPILNVDDLVLVFWGNFYELLEKYKLATSFPGSLLFPLQGAGRGETLGTRLYKLEDWWRSTRFFRPLQEDGNVT